MLYTEETPNPEALKYVTNRMLYRGVADFKEKDLAAAWSPMANSLMERWGSAGKPPWGEYSTWKLPEQLVWAPIIGVALLLISSGVLQRAGGWLTLVAGLLYFFQGLAVVVALLARWKVPVFVRIILYFVLLIQSYSLILLAILGLSDVWLNMRQTSKERYNNE